MTLSDVFTKKKFKLQIDFYSFKLLKNSNLKFLKMTAVRKNKNSWKNGKKNFFAKEYGKSRLFVATSFIFFQK